MSCELRGILWGRGCQAARVRQGGSALCEVPFFILAEIHTLS